MVAECSRTSDMCAHANLFWLQGKENPRERINRILEEKEKGKAENNGEIALIRSWFQNLFSLIDILDMLYGATLWRGFSFKEYTEWHEKLVASLQSLWLSEENLLRTIWMKISELLLSVIVNKLIDSSLPEKDRKMLDSLMLAANTIIAADLNWLGLRVQAF